MSARKDLYEEVTRQVIEALEAGVVPWHKPWSAPSDMPASLSTGREYRGINVFLLTMRAQSSGYSSRWWGTFKEIQRRGGHVRKGERGQTVVFWKFLEVDDQQTNEKRSIPFLRSFTVFNADQADELSVPVSDAGELRDVDPIEAAEAIAAEYLSGGPGFVSGSSQAFYGPGADQVHMPERGYFDSSEAFYSVLFHELTHSTGHASRLARPDLLQSHRFGDASYSREELTAEMGAAMICAAAGIEQTTIPQTAAYIESWLRTLRADARAVVVAAGHAQKAADLILGSAS